MIPQINDVSFGAKLIPGTVGGPGNKKLLNMFEQKTSQYANYSLLQEKLNFLGKDTFCLLNNRNEKVMSMQAPHSCYSYSCVEEVADQYVKIFKDLIKGLVD